MKISYDWLQQYIDLNESPEEIAKVLTSTGLEVESVETFESVRGGLKGLVIGEVMTCVKHPNADKLSLTTVDAGTGSLLQIVCGAPNVAAGQKVVVALPGTTVHPLKGESFTIKSAKIRGEQSDGMICSAAEIGLADNHQGIIVLPGEGLRNGTSAAVYYNIYQDSVLEIGLTPNRADAASHIGVARDIRAAKKRPLRWPSTEGFQVASRELTIPVVVENAAACWRYSAVTLTSVRVAESPDWLKNRLRSIGLNPINNIVDITNFVLHECGQPLHAFDADAITSGKVVVKTLPSGSPFKTLDGKERTLLATDLMICNGSAPICIAGVMGGLASGISGTTTRVFLESACFAPASIRKTALHHQLKTDASFRFERGTDPNITLYALKRAATLICEIAGGQVSSVASDWYPEKIENRFIGIKDKNVRRLIGKAIPRETIFGILESLDIPIIQQSDDYYTVAVPPYRVDVTTEADVIEEILRVYGFNNIELSEIAGTGFLSEFPVKDPNKFRRSIGELLIANGFYEIMTNSLTNVAYQEKHHLVFPGEPVSILNKLSEEQGILRQTMLFTGLEVCAHNIHRKQKDLKLYEFGKVYRKAIAEPGKVSKFLYQEEERLCFYVTGNTETENWQRATHAMTYYDLAQYCSIVFQKCLSSDTGGSQQNLRQEKIDDPLFDYGMKISNGKEEIGRLGKVKTALVKEFGIKQEIFYADLSVALLFKSANPKFEVQEVPKFPEVRRDLSLVLDKHVTFAEIQELVLATEKRLIKEIIAFDVYEGDKIPEGKKAYALGFTLLDDGKTLTDEEIDTTMARLMGAFEQKMGALIRK